MSGLHLGCCVSSHGFGHAARTSAILQALAELAQVRCTVVSLVPHWFFQSSLPCPFTYYPWQSDIGLVQKSALREDLPATVRELSLFYPLRQELVARVAAVFAHCDLVLCDIAPLGIAAARQAGVPSVLLENFTWDWLYEGFLERCAELSPFVSCLRDLNRQADYHIQTLPVCAPGPCDLLAGPIARRIRSSRAEVRQMLGIAADQPLVLVSLGGLGMAGVNLCLPEDGSGTLYLVAGKQEEGRAQKNVRFLPPESGLDHPELVAACDAVIGKAGYSTLAEVYRAQVPFGYIQRQGFRESGPLVSFIRQEMAGLEITERELADGSLAAKISSLLALVPPSPRLPDGAGQCAAFLAALPTRRQRKG
ncbi:MAG TPA: hypothetical protein DDY20_11105 [Desulfobulbaceae bacterium]|nr:hypothetical protein [Desulfobulbaceae bacterium]